jgi:hypothetical protein
MPKIPPTLFAWILSLSGIVLLLLSFAIHWPMLLVAFGNKHVAPGGGEYMAAFLVGLPMLLLGCLLLGVVSFSAKLKSLLSLVPFLLSILGILAWIVALARN